MRKAIPLRADYTGDELRKLARASDDANQTRRLLALASIYDGGWRSDAAKLGGVTARPSHLGSTVESPASMKSMTYTNSR